MQIDGEREQEQKDMAQETEVIEGGKAPPGWRVDKFSRLGRARLVSVPPWSRRPPHCEPEVWVGILRSLQKKEREAWARDDPKGFAAQEARRSEWLKANSKGVVAAAIATAGVRDAPSELRVRPDVPGERSDHPSVGALAQQVRNMITTDDYGFMLLELGCADDFELSAAVLPGCLAVRITAKEDLTLKSTRQAIHGMIRLCYLYKMEFHV